MPEEVRTSSDHLDSRGKQRSDFWTVNTEPSKTVQSDWKQADINQIMKQFGNVGVLEHLQQVDGLFMDVTEFTDYVDLRRHVAAAEAEFMKLPSKVREAFDHDVAVWLDTAHDKEKQDALVEAGIIEAPPSVPEGSGEGAPVASESEGAGAVDGA